MSYTELGGLVLGTGLVAICSSSNGQNHGSSGKTGAKAIAVQTKNKVTRRVPNRSMSTPTWIDKNTASNDRAPTSIPIAPALIPSERP